MAGQAFAVGMRAQGKDWEDPTKDPIHSFIYSFIQIIIMCLKRATCWARCLGYINNTVPAHKELTI